MRRKQENNILVYYENSFDLMSPLNNLRNPRGPWWHFENYLAGLCACSAMSDSLQPHGLYSLSGFSVYGIFQARIVEWVAISFPRGSSRPRDQTHVSCLAGGFYTTEPLGASPSNCIHLAKKHIVSKAWQKGESGCGKIRWFMYYMMLSAEN